jgi:hypothetical protein
MRPVLLAFPLLLVVPSAAAQDLPVDLVTVEIAPFEEPARPLQGAIATEATVRVSCAHANPPGIVHVTHMIAETPTWASTLVSPATDTAGPERCESGYVTFIATLTTNVSDQAPAHAPAPIVMASQVGGASPDEGRASVDVSAAWFSIVDVQLAEAIAVVAPGASHTFAVKLTNLGNGETEVTLTPGDVGEGISVRVSEPFRLGSTQAGSNDISREATIEVTADDASGFVNRVAVANVHITSAYAADATQSGDDASVSVLVTVRGGTAETLDRIPAPSLLLALLGGALVARARR